MRKVIHEAWVSVFVFFLCVYTSVTFACCGYDDGSSSSSAPFDYSDPVDGSTSSYGYDSYSSGYGGASNFGSPGSAPGDYFGNPPDQSFGSSYGATGGGQSIGDVMGSPAATQATSPGSAFGAGPDAFMGSPAGIDTYGGGGSGWPSSSEAPGFGTGYVTESAPALNSMPQGPGAGFGAESVSTPSAGALHEPYVGQSNRDTFESNASAAQPDASSIRSGDHLYLHSDGSTTTRWGHTYVHSDGGSSVELSAGEASHASPQIIIEDNGSTITRMGPIYLRDNGGSFAPWGNLNAAPGSRDRTYGY